MKQTDKYLLVYLLGAIGQIMLISALVLLFRRAGYGIDYSTGAGLFFILAGGCSSALWGSIVSVKLMGIPGSKLLSDFWNMKTPFRYYLLAALFLLIDFSFLLVGGRFNTPTWYTPILIFLKAILFGGIEEIGWRYTFQPLVEKKVGFIGAVLATFAMWGIWHYFYFFIEGSLDQLRVIEFYSGLLTNCFLLGAIYHKSRSLWLCVATHAMINTLSLTFPGGSGIIGYAAKLIIIVISALLIH